MMKKKMREIAIFRNKLKVAENTFLHEDDMPTYTTWCLVEDHGVEKVIYRGESNKVPLQVESMYSVSENLSKIGNPAKILITFSEKDTY